MNLDDLRCFVTVAETLSFRHSAELLYISQPALSRRVAAVERELGTPLLRRTTRSVELTEEGAACLKHIKQLLEDYRQLLSRVEDLRAGITGVLSIGYHGNIGVHYIASLSALLRRQYPRLRVEAVCNRPNELKNELADGIDMAITSRAIAASYSDVETLSIARQSASILVRADHPLAGLEAVSVDMLRGEPLITQTREFSPQMFDATMRIFVHAGFQPNIVLRTDADAMVKVCMGMGIGIQPVNMSLFNVLPPELRCVPIKDLEGRSELRAFDTVLTWRRRPTNPAVGLVTSLIKNGTIHGNQITDVIGEIIPV